MVDVKDVFIVEDNNKKYEVAVVSDPHRKGSIDNVKSKFVTDHKSIMYILETGQIAFNGKVITSEFFISNIEKTYKSRMSKKN